MYSQLDPQWKSVKIGSTSLTIGSYGCTLTCLAEISKRGNHAFNPKQLAQDKALTNANGEVLWNEVFKKIGGVEKYSRYYGSMLPKVEADQSLLLNVAINTQYGKHWVIWNGSTILDPLGGVERPANYYRVIGSNLITWTKKPMDKLIKSPTRNTVYAYNGQKKCPLPDMDTLEFFFGKNAYIAPLPDVEVEKIPTDTMIPSMAVTEKPVEPETLYYPLKEENQGVYPVCVAINIVRACEEAYYRSTGVREEFSVKQLYSETGGSGEGLSATVVHEHIRKVGLIREAHNPMPDVTKKAPKGWATQWRKDAEAAKDFMRFKFGEVLIESKLDGSVEDLESLKKGVRKYHHLTATVNNKGAWDEGELPPEGKWMNMHRIVISGWDKDAILGHNSWSAQKHKVRLNLAYPLAWVYGYEYLV